MSTFYVNFAVENIDTQHTMKLSKIKPNPDNPRVLRDDKFRKLVKSLKEFPQMMEKRPIVVDEDCMILGGNMRYKALCEIYGKKGEIPDEWVSVAKGWTADQKREFVIKDNASFGEWDWDALANEWEAQDLSEWGVDFLHPDDDEKAKKGTGERKPKIVIECDSDEEQLRLFNELHLLYGDKVMLK